MASTETQLRLPSFIWVVSFIVPLLLTTPSSSQSPGPGDIFSRGFTASNLSFSGGAEVLDNGLIRLTNNSPRVLGHAFYSSPVRFKASSGDRVASFSTAFAFSIVPQYRGLGGHGFAFVISKSRNLPGALSTQYLGLMNSSDMGNFSNHLFAVEFDTVRDLEFNDINDNHIGIDINSLKSNKSVTAGYFPDHNSTLSEIHLNSGKLIQAWIDYDSVKNQLDVRISLSSVKPTRPVLSTDVNLSYVFEDSMFVGFSASTGLLASSHYVLGWTFSINGEAKSLDLPSLPSLPSSRGKNRKVLIFGTSVSASMAMIVLASISIYLIYRIRNADVIEPWELDVGPHRFPYGDLRKATKGFRDKELLGSGGFGQVYKGTLPNSKTEVAVKRIINGSKQGLKEFMSEVSTIGRLRHRNLVQLLGWCRRRDDFLLVYDYMPNGSLDKHLFDEPKSILSWEQRLKIIRGVASGLLYLHEEWEQVVIHRDIKAGNVLLDGELNGRLGDFGLAKLYEHGQNPSTTRVVGTLGYLAPELTRTGKPTAASDVFAFGALLLEVVCGRRPFEPKAMPEELILLDWVWEKWSLGAILEVVDPRLEGQFDEAAATMLLKLGMICSNSSPEIRPTMRQVVRYLDGELVLPEKVLPPDGNHDIKKVSSSSPNGSDTDHKHSSQSDRASSYYEKVTMWSSTVDELDHDLEAGPSSPVSGSSIGDHR